MSHIMKPFNIEINESIDGSLVLNINKYLKFIKAGDTLNNGLIYIPLGDDLYIYYGTQKIGSVKWCADDPQRGYWSCQCIVPNKWVPYIYSCFYSNEYNKIPSQVPRPEIFDDKSGTMIWSMDKIDHCSNDFSGAIKKIWITWKTLESNSPDS
ncbi:hypothetical protein QKC54_gp0106 [Megavirus baoshan]|uniref:Uncharacterized protein n=1 Tax=Megavirus baoshan TaxID=2496520 RepID=A0A3Q8U8M1_9VIRU|nr:hypothetical protein QKC54_gp0106 [Megavirus baoshan]AZL89805.1 hypothetical protein Mb0966 [Megavirus baoshan]